MPKRKRKTGMEEATAIVTGFATIVDALLMRYTGKTMQTLLTESAQRPKELPAGKSQPVQQNDMSLADAYGILGCPPGTPIEEITKRYRVLARLFHPDYPGGYVEAMRLLNVAYDRIKQEGGRQ